jgi:adenosylhomocysteine nucleosidase
VKEFLSRAGREYIVRNVDDDPTAYEELIRRGFRTIPVTIVGDRAVRGFAPAELKAALDAAS